MTCGSNRHNAQISHALDKEIGTFWRLLNRYRKTRDAGYIGAIRYVNHAEEVKNALITLLEIRKAGRE